jgi:hypothetical protein
LGVVDTFEPDTGLVRFSLVNDSDSPACSYGTPRRGPSNREKQLPPKNARCKKGGATSGGASGSAATSDNSPKDSTTIPGLEESIGSGDQRALPQRMSEWSWTLFYLNAI